MVRDLVYLSEQKLNACLLGATDPRFPSLNGSLEVPLGPVTAQVGLGGRATGAQITEAGLERAIKRLVKHHAPRGLGSENLRPNQWVHFDLDLALKTAHEDSGAIPDDVVLLAGSFKSEGPAVVESALLLCGSIQHLRVQVESAGRMGSGTSWLHGIIREIARRDAQGIGVIPEFLTEMTPHRRPVGKIEDAAYGVHSWMSAEHPPNRRSPMRGYAKILMDVGPPHFIQRLVVATPLFVENSPQRPARQGLWRRRASRRRTRLT
ncbi:SAVMC3_10250 family protein [Streptomyces sp. NPDC059142]|uniref:SAVMC3_10250 family protein n=1 Tax=Streptomyces sp. NPDC059142 TaxID=3346739 RepID=UPI003688EC11